MATNRNEANEALEREIRRLNRGWNRANDALLSERRARVGVDTVLDQIAAVLSGNEWDSETVEGIAHIIRATGRHIVEPSDELTEDQTDEREA